MESTDIKYLENGFLAAGRRCRLIDVALGVLIVVLALIWLPALAISCIQLGNSASFSTVFYLLLYGVLVFGVMGTLKLIFHGIVKGESPFSERQADRLRFISFLALMFVFLEFAFTWGIAYELIPQAGYSVLINYGGNDAAININSGLCYYVLTFGNISICCVATAAQRRNRVRELLCLLFLVSTE